MADYVAMVEKVIVNGKHGPYAVATSEDLGNVTFSLNPPVWQEGDWPKGGHQVVLSKIRKKRAGWQAESVRFYGPDDEKQKQQQKKGVSE